MSENADDFARSALLRCADGSGDGLMILLGELHHQRPDAPPPPDQPPPPEKPPPNPPLPIPPLPIPPPQPEPQVGPPMMIVRPPFLIARRDPEPVALPIRYQMKKNISMGSSGARRSLITLEASSLRTRTFGCQSVVSPLRTLTIPSTPRSMPPEKSPVLKRGTMALEIITEDNASVRVPSRP